MAGLRSLGKAKADPAADGATQRRFAQQIGSLDLLNGQLVDCIIPEGRHYARVRHSLGRAYRGGIVLAVSIYADNLRIVHPRAAIEDPERIDPAKELLITSDEQMDSDNLITLWVL